MGQERNEPSVKSASSGIELGAFRLVGSLGRGAMGRVWRGEHAVSGLPVAIKVMTATRARAPAYARVFRNEVEAVARLSHPGIVRLFDFGEVPPAAAAHGLQQGAPYLVMELASQGSLDEAGAPGEWRSLKVVLLALLDALAHAHARGIVHRDLKPANVLVDRQGSEPNVFKLTDFGISQAARDDASSVEAPWAVSGTPLFMAPEQFTTDSRDQGPWTDFYALGCTAHALTSGAPPFRHDDLIQLARAHQSEPLPTLVPRFPVPHGFEGWLQVLLAKRPGDRFHCAADARFALEKLDDRAVARSSKPAAPLQLLAETTPLEIADELLVTAERAWLSKSSPTLTRREPPPLPPDWRTRGESHELPLTGAGAGIFGLRSLPMVDWDDERTALWSLLREVHTDRTPRAALLRGSAGSGKSRVARWIAERAAEVGGANVMRASHSLQHGTHDGVVAMLARYLRCDALQRESVRERLSRTLAELGVEDGYLLDAFTDLLVAPADEAALDNPGARAEAKSRLLLRCLQLIATERPVILVLDDVHWGLDALRLVHLLLRERPRDTPVLALLTARDEALRTRTLERQELDALMATDGTLEFGVAELAPADQRRLIEQLLGLSGELVETIARRSGGNPLFAVQLVGDWIARGLLVATDRGLTLPAGVGLHLPDDIHALCAARIEQALETRTEDDRLALELAALLGGEVQEAEWTRACVLAQLLPAGELPHELARLGLLERGASSWRFAHGVLRESLQRTAQTHGRLARHHGVVATVLRERYPNAATSDLAARIGRHLAEAGELDEAHRWLLNAARMLRLEADHERAEALLAERDALLDRLGAPPIDMLRAKGALLAVHLDSDRGRLDAAETRAREVLQQAHDWPLIEAHAALRLGHVLLARENYDTALPFLEQALATLAEAGDGQGEFEARAGIAEVRYYQASRDAAEAAYRDNLALARELGDAIAMAESHWGLGYVAMWQNRFDDAQQHFEAMRELLVQRGAWYRLDACMNALGELARLAGRYTEAEQHYREVLKLIHARGWGNAMSVRFNLVMVRLCCGDTARAERMLPALLDEARKQNRPHAVSLGLAIQAALDAEDARWESFDTACAAIEQIQLAKAVREGDVAIMLKRAADSCRARGERARARTALAIAREQWRRLGRADEALAVDSELAALG